MSLRFQCYRTTGNFFHWRLLSRNHRIVALAPGRYADAALARSAARLVREHAGTAVIELASERGAAWTWAMRVGGELVAISAHTYGRRIEALAAARRFRLGAAEARIEERIPLLGDNESRDSESRDGETREAGARETGTRDTGGRDTGGRDTGGRDTGTRHQAVGPERGSRRQ